MVLKFKGDNQKVIKVFAITAVVSMVLAIGILALTDSFPFCSYSSDSCMMLCIFVFLAILFGLIAGTYKYDKLKKESGVDNGKELSAEDKLEIQVENYNDLGITESSRGQASLFFGIVSVISIIFGIFNIVSLMDVLYDLIIFIPLIFFIYRGHRWAMYLGIVLWTLGKWYQIFSLNSKGTIVAIFVWWLWFVVILYNAIKVENKRKKRKNVEKKAENIESAYEDKSVLESKFFCPSCGKEINYKGKFCKFCGNKLV